MGHGAAWGLRRLGKWLMELWLVYKGLQRVLGDNQREGVCRPHNHPQRTQTYPHAHTYADSRERWDGRFQIIKQTEALMMKFWRLGVTRGTLQGSQPFPCWVFCSLYPPHNITFPPLCSLGGRWVGELCYIPVYLFMTSSRQFCTW